MLNIKYNKTYEGLRLILQKQPKTRFAKKFPFSLNLFFPNAFEIY